MKTENAVNTGLIVLLLRNVLTLKSGLKNTFLGMGTFKNLED